MIVLIDDLKNQRAQSLIKKLSLLSKSNEYRKLKILFFDQKAMYGELVGEELQLKPMSISIQFLKTVYSIARSKNSCTVIFNNDFSELDDISKFIAINSATVFKLNNHKVQKEYNFINITSDEEMLYILQKIYG